MPPQYYFVRVKTLNGPETRVYKARSVGDVENKVRTSSALGIISIWEVSLEICERHKRA